MPKKYSAKAAAGVAFSSLIQLATTEAFRPSTNNVESLRCLRLQPKRLPSVLFSETSDESLPARSIGDVVQGLHGSKYQFSNSGINFEGQQFAETGYGCSAPPTEEDYSKEPIPNWALKLKDVMPSDEAPSIHLTGDSGTVTIQNEERSWEKYYAFLIGGDSESLVVEPNVGMLAPRGGTEYFQDFEQLTVHGEAAGRNSFLVVGTEAETWIYKII